MFASLLRPDAARRATDVVAAVLAHRSSKGEGGLAHGVRCALTGGLAIDAQLGAHGRPVEPRVLNDIDLVVQDFASIPESLAASFLACHVHADAIEGKTLLQLVDETRAVRIDFFRAFGSTLSRAGALDDQTGALDVLCVEDLIARTTALVCGRLQRSETVDVKYARAFARLRGLGRPEQLTAAWNDHRQQLTGTFDAASTEATRLLETRPDLVVVESYSREVVPCDRCRAHGRFRPAPAARIVEILGYC